MNNWDAEAEVPPEREVSYGTVPDPEELARVAAALRGARDPAIVVGAGVDRAGALHDAVALAEKLRAPVWRDAVPALAAFPQDHQLFRGNPAFGQRQVAAQLSGLDAVLALGAPDLPPYPYA